MAQSDIFAPTPAEKAVLDSLVTAWNAFVDLPEEHPTDRADFVFAMNILQRHILSRPGRRWFNGHGEA